MALQCGIVGLPNVGKSTLFNALSSAKAESANYPFCTIEPNVGVVTVPDERLNILKGLVNPQKVIPTIIEFVDIAGLVKGASKGEGLGNQFLANIREVDAIVHVVRCFDDENIVHVEGKINPVQDKEVIDTELQIKDLESIDKRYDRAKKITSSGDKEAKRQLEVYEKLKTVLESGKNGRSAELSKEEWVIVNDLNLLTTKPVLYVANVDIDSLEEDNQYVSALREAIVDENAQLIRVSAALEAEIAELGEEEEKLAFLEEYGLKESGLSRLIRAAYALLNLITYFTAGEKEVRAWTIQKGWKAPQAAGVIHTDFEKGFIRAEVIKLANYQELKTEKACRENGKLAVEGKEYLVEDGDIMHFLFNV